MVLSKKDFEFEIKKSQEVIDGCKRAIVINEIVINAFKEENKKIKNA